MSGQIGVDVTAVFAGDGLAIPSDAEWDRADRLLAEHGLPLIARRRDGEVGRTIPCNRSWMRSQMRRALRRAGVAVTYADGSVGWGCPNYDPSATE